MEDKKMPVLTRFEHFWTVKSKWNALMAMKWHTKLKGKWKSYDCFSRPLVQFQGHIGQTRSLGRSQLSNPSDLPCFRCNDRNMYEGGCLPERWIILRADSRFAPSQWETALLCNDVSHWQDASLESSLTWEWSEKNIWPWPPPPQKKNKNKIK